MRIFRAQGMVEILRRVYLTCYRQYDRGGRITVDPSTHQNCHRRFSLGPRYDNGIFRPQDPAPGDSCYLTQSSYGLRSVPITRPRW